ncbi:hypothetical protein BGW41_005923 [Actinomortierella wolfii]|nr:hypothetical protein BGW41_005923 [Actinomortierella wolfii]
MPKRSCAIMILAVIATLSTLFVSSILTAMISRADMEISPNATGVHTAHSSTDPSFWTTYMSAEWTVEEALVTMLNDTHRNPNPQPAMRYKPRTYAFETVCDDSIAALGDGLGTIIKFPSTTIKCKAYGLVLHDGINIWNPQNVSYSIVDSSTFMWTTPTVKLDKYPLDKTTEPHILAHGAGRDCFPSISYIDSGLVFTEFPREGMIFLPKTLSTKCHYGITEESVAVSATYFEFAIGSIQDFDKVTTSILDDPISLPLLKYMKTAIDSGVFENPTNNSTMVVFAKIPSASDVDFFLCRSKYRKEQGTMGLLCNYILTSIIVIGPQAVDPVIAANLPHASETRNSFNTTSQLSIIIHHLPQNAEQDGEQKPSPMFSSSHLIKANAGAIRYLASLGHNVYIYEEQESKANQLYILYDSVEIRDAYEISTAAFVAVCALVVLFGYIGANARKLPVVYNSTLYMTIYKELNNMNRELPMLLHHTHNPLAFDDKRVILSSNGLRDATSETQNRMIPLRLRNSVTDHQQDHQSMGTLEETTIHHPSLSSLSTVTSTPIMSSATSNTDTITESTS